jgi:hypothetical protein
MAQGFSPTTNYFRLSTDLKKSLGDLGGEAGKTGGELQVYIAVQV